MGYFYIFYPYPRIGCYEIVPEKEFLNLSIDGKNLFDDCELNKVSQGYKRKYLNYCEASNRSAS